MTKVLVVSNCTTPGLARSLALLCPDLEVSGKNITAARADLDELRADVAAASRLVLLPEARQVIGNQIPAKMLKDKQVVTVPGFYFSGYHPDTCYVRSSKGYPVNTRFGAYHSVIALVGFLQGLTQQDTIALYNARTYAALGYFDEWDRQRSLLVQTFAAAGLDIAPAVQRWARAGCFMHTVNHPHAAVLHDVARVVAQKLDTRVLDYPVAPADTLLENAIYPCYPEIAENCGAQGSTLFKQTKRDTVVDLADFVALSYFTYNRHDQGDLHFPGEYKAKAAALQAYLSGTATQGSAA